MILCYLYTQQTKSLKAMKSFIYGRIISLHQKRTEKGTKLNKHYNDLEERIKNGTTELQDYYRIALRDIEN